MDAVEYLNEKVRMCIEHRCGNCPLGKAGDEQYYSSCRAFEEEHPEEAVAIVEKWETERSKKTRQNEFLNMFPNAPLNPMNDMTISISPCEVDAKYEPHKGCDETLCSDCQREYWHEEVGS